MRSLASRDRGLATDAQDPDVFFADRRWILGERNQPVPSLEKVARLPKNTNHYVQSSLYSVVVTDKTHLKFTVVLHSGPKEAVTDFNKPIDVVLPAPVDGYFLVSPCMGKMYLINNSGNMVEFPEMQYPLTNTSFFWFEHGGQMHLLAGSQFSHIVCFHISKSGIKEQQLYFAEEKAPISSLALITYNNTKYILVATFINLLVLKWDDMSANPVLFGKVERTCQKKMYIPSFVATNGEYIAWMTNEELRVYTPGQLLDDEPGSIAIPFSQLKNVLFVEPQIFLSQLTQPIVMSKNYIIIGATSSQSSNNPGTSTIIGFDVKTLKVAFRFPIANENERVPLSIYFNQKEQFITVMTDSFLYKLDLKDEKPFSVLKTISDEKEEMKAEMKSSEIISTAELLSLFLEMPDFRSATHLLKTTLASIKQPVISEDESEPLSEEAVQEICMQFLIYELNVISMCSKDGKGDLRVIRQLNTHGKFDMLASLAHIIRLREFSKAGEKLSDNGLIASHGKCETAVAMLLEKAVDQGHRDAKIINLLRKGLDEDNQNVVISPLNPTAREDAASMITINNFGEKETREAIKKILNPEAASKHDEFVRNLKPEIVKQVSELITFKGLDNDQIDAITNALDMIVNLKNSERLLPSIIMRYRDIVKNKFKHPDATSAKQIFESLRYMPGQIPAPSCFELLRLLSKQNPASQQKQIAQQKPPLDEIVWELALAEGNAEEKDDQLYDILVNTTYDVVLSNKPETYQHLVLAKMYRSAAQVALHANMILQSVHAASLIDKSNKNRDRYIRRFIRYAPKTMWEELCQKYGITHMDEVEKDESGITKDKLAKKFEEMKTKIEDLQNKARDSAEFLQVLDDWGSETNPPSEVCTFCGKPIGSDLAYSFACGHCFHSSCLSKAAVDTLSADEQFTLTQLEMSKKPTAQEIQERENLLLSDCPECGQRAVNLIRIPIIKTSNWGMPY